MEALFGSKCNIQKVIKTLDKETGQREFGFEEFYISMYLVAPKALSKCQFSQS
jgi:hypothetical protein